MEVLVPTSSSDFNFDSTCSSPYITAPSSPKYFGNCNFFSAPSSPMRSLSIYRDFSNLSVDRSSANSLNYKTEDQENDDDFQFDFSGQLVRDPLTADELFDHGKIKPFKKTPSAESIKIEVIKTRDSRKGGQGDRGRERTSSPRTSAAGSHRRRRPSRSLSPFKVFNYEGQLIQQEQPQKQGDFSSKQSVSCQKQSRKWRLKDLFLFRSSSEGRAVNQETLRKYNDIRNSSTGSMDNGGSVHGSKRGTVSPHELHYTTNRAVSEELKRRTFLPYRQGLLGCLGFNPTIDSLSRGFNSIVRR